jgi:2TM domain-containing protein
MDSFERAASREGVDQARIGFRIHLFVYVAVQVMLAAIWWFTSNQGEVMPWFIFPLLGWGIGVVAHYAAVRSRLRAKAEPPAA